MGGRVTSEVTDRLAVGTGSGYNAALIAQIVGDSGSVVTIDVEPDLVDQARTRLAAAGFRNVTAVCGDGADGAPGHAPYDRIIVTAGVWDLAKQWLTQLRGEGRIVAPVSVRGIQMAVAFEHAGTHWVGRQACRCQFIRMTGMSAGPETVVPLGPQPGLHALVADGAVPEADPLYEGRQRVARSDVEPDGVLIGRSMRGRPDSFVEVVRRHEIAIHGYLARRAGRQGGPAAAMSQRPLAPEDDWADPWDGVNARLDSAERAKTVVLAVQELPAAEREVLLLVAWEQLTPAEAARVLGVAQGTVRSRLHRARAALRRALSGRDWGESTEAPESNTPRGIRQYPRTLSAHAHDPPDHPYPDLGLPARRVWQFWIVEHLAVRGVIRLPGR